MPVEQQPDAGPGPHDGAPGGRARAGRLLTVVVASVEALVAAAAAVLSVLSGLQGGSLVLGAAVGGVAAGVAYLLGEVARGLARGLRWPTGVFVTTQVLVALVALSLGGRSLLTAAENPLISLFTVAALALAAAGLVGLSLLGRARGAGATEEEPPPVF